MLTWALVVADSEVWGDTTTSVGKTAGRAVVGGAGDLGGVLPDDLGEVAPGLEIAHVGLLSVESGVEGLLSVVEHVADDSRDVVGSNTSSDVLAVSTTSSGAAKC